ncbi:MAG TPA: SWIM zinc finger family protein, partial [Bacteroidetes bacterium]|nr:SWIM zinc finger family protein [Bacteroidota bacterium]
MDLTPQKINAYAPDAATARRAAGIAHARIWHTLEGNGRAIWGTYGYAPDPFRVAVDFEGPAFKCTCPVRRKPCKHSIALLLIFAKNNDAFRVVTDPPQWAGSWLHKRDQQAVKRTNITREVKRTPEEEKALAEKRRAARDKRIEKMAAGLELFEQWLLDLFRQGLASLENHSCQYWDSLQSRMADAGLTAIARRLRQLPEIMTRHDWHELLLAELGDIYLIVKGFKNIEKLPPLLQDDLLSLSGLNFKKADVLAGAGLKDVWLVVGQTEEQEEAQLIARRTWLVGKQSKHNVLLLDFAWGGKGFDTEFKLGTTAAAEAFFYPSAYPQRVLFADIALTDQPFDPGNGYPDLTAFANAYAKAIGQFPWLAQFP